MVVALPGSAHQRLNWVVAELHDLPVKVWVIPDYFSLALHRATVEIDVSVAGHSSTYVFNCVSEDQLVVIQPLGMR